MHVTSLLTLGGQMLPAAFLCTSENLCFRVDLIYFQVAFREFIHGLSAAPQFLLCLKQATFALCSPL